MWKFEEWERVRVGSWHVVDIFTLETRLFPNPRDIVPAKLLLPLQRRFVNKSEFWDGKKIRRLENSCLLSLHFLLLPFSSFSPCSVFPKEISGVVQRDPSHPWGLAEWFAPRAGWWVTALVVEKDTECSQVKFSHSSSVAHLSLFSFITYY